MAAKQKYILTNNTKTITYGGQTITLHQIQSCRYITTAGGHEINNSELGGWIEKESNLTQSGTCWVERDACVFGDAVVYENAYVFGNAIVCGRAKVHGNARVLGHVEIYDDAEVFGNAKLYCRAKVFNHAQVYDDADVEKIVMTQYWFKTTEFRDIETLEDLQKWA